MGIKYSVNERAFLQWEHDMAYVLGFIFADGGLEDTTLRGKYLRVTSNDKQLIDHVKRFLQAAHPVTLLPPRYSGGTGCYFMRIGSHALYETLMHHGLRPRKSLTIEMPKVPKKFMGDFVRGVFDGDGCVYIERKKNKKEEIMIKRLSVIFTSGSERFLEQLAQVLHESSKVKVVPVYTSRRSYQLRYSTSESMLLFKFLYSSSPQALYLSRKFAIFKEYFLSKPAKVDRKIRKIVA